MYSLANGLAKSACSPRRKDFKSWPAKVNLDVKVPLEDPQVFKTIKSVPEQPVDVAEGVRWYIDKERGAEVSADGSMGFGLPGGVLELRDSESDATTNYSVKVWLQGCKEPVPEAYATIIELNPGDGRTIRPNPGAQRTIRVSRAIKDTKAIDRIEFLRQRFRFERIKGVETHLDLLPSGP
jgi:hypothetical protein